MSIIATIITAMTKTTYKVQMLPTEDKKGEVNFALCPVLNKLVPYSYLYIIKTWKWPFKRVVNEFVMFVKIMVFHE